MSRACGNTSQNPFLTPKRRGMRKMPPPYKWVGLNISKWQWSLYSSTFLPNYCGRFFSILLWVSGAEFKTTFILFFSEKFKNCIFHNTMRVFLWFCLNLFNTRSCLCQIVSVGKSLWFTAGGFKCNILINKSIKALKFKFPLSWKFQNR